MQRSRFGVGVDHLCKPFDVKMTLCSRDFAARFIQRIDKAKSGDPLVQRFGILSKKKHILATLVPTHAEPVDTLRNVHFLPSISRESPKAQARETVGRLFVAFKECIEVVQSGRFRQPKRCCLGRLI